MKDSILITHVFNTNFCRVSTFYCGHSWILLPTFPLSFELARGSCVLELVSIIP